MKKTLITGGSGFIGATMVRRWLTTTDYALRVLCRRTRPARLDLQLLNHSQVKGALNCGRLEIIYSDLLGDISGICEGVDYVVHAAAKTFVDHSIRDPRPFFETNVMGTLNILEDARRHGVKKFLQVSTDEVYGSIAEGAYKEDAKIAPSNPYSASKAAADAIVQSYATTYGMNTVITRTENNYGPYQHPQKALPTFVRKLAKQEKIPVYGDGGHVRQWLWVEDHVDAIALLLTTNTVPGEIFHVAGNCEVTNLELAHRIIGTMAGKLDKKLTDEEYADHIEFIDDSKIRPGHDRRYALNSDKLRMLGWTPQMSLEDGLARAVAFYLVYPEWC